MKLSEEAKFFLGQLSGSKEDKINRLKSIEIEDMPDHMHAEMESLLKECISYLEQSDDYKNVDLLESSIL